MSAPDATLSSFMGYDMKRAFNVIQNDLNVTLQPFGLRMVTFSVLVVIRDNPGLKQTQLAEILSIERPNMVLVLDDLEQMGAVVRGRSPDDRRAHELTVTLKGRRLCDRAIDAVRRHDARLAAGISDAARRSLHAALRQIQMNAGTQDDHNTVSGT